MSASRQIIWFIVLAVTAGCISFRGRALERLDYSDLQPAQSKPSISYTAKVIRTLDAPIIEKFQLNGTLPLFQDEINRVLVKSGLFSNIEYGQGKAGLSLDMTLYAWNQGTSSKSLWTQYYWYLSGITLNIFPYYYEEHLLLHADILSGGQVIQQYEFSHSVNNLGEFLLVFYLPFNDKEKVIRMAVDDLILNLLVGLQHDRFL